MANQDLIENQLKLKETTNARIAWVTDEINSIKGQVLMYEEIITQILGHIPAKQEEVDDLESRNILIDETIAILEQQP